MTAHTLCPGAGRAATATTAMPYYTSIGLAATATTAMPYYTAILAQLLIHE